MGKAQQLFDFYDALKFVAKGDKIHKNEWKDKGYYGFLNDRGHLCLHQPDGLIATWLITDGDMAGTDYIVLT